MAYQFNQLALRGERLNLEITLLENGLPVDLTSWATTDLTYLFGSFGAAPLHTLTIGSGITVLDAPNGRIRILLSATALDIAPGAYTHELWNFRSGAKRPFFQGRVALNDSVEFYAP